MWHAQFAHRVGREEAERTGSHQGLGGTALWAMLKRWLSAVTAEFQLDPFPRPFVNDARNASRRSWGAVSRTSRIKAASQATRTTKHIHLRQPTQTANAIGGRLRKTRASTAAGSRNASRRGQSNKGTERRGLVLFAVGLATRPSPPRAMPTPGRDDGPDVRAARQAADRIGCDP